MTKRPSLGTWAALFLWGALIGCGNNQQPAGQSATPVPVGLPARLAQRDAAEQPAKTTTPSLVDEVSQAAAAAQATVVMADPEDSSGTAGDRTLRSGTVRTARSETGQPRVRLETSLGDVVIELWPHAAPQTVRNFLAYVDDGHYDETIFHQIVAGHMILGGGFTEGLEEKPVGPPIENESDAEVSNRRGTIAMARPFDRIHGATCQFFINLADNPKLDHRSNMTEEFGYCVFGEVVAGLEVVEEIGQVATRNTREFELLPSEPVVIRRAVREASPAPDDSQVARRRGSAPAARPR